MEKGLLLKFCTTGNLVRVPGVLVRWPQQTRSLAFCMFRLCSYFKSAYWRQLSCSPCQYIINKLCRSTKRDPCRANIRSSSSLDTGHRWYGNCYQFIEEYWSTGSVKRSEIRWWFINNELWNWYVQKLQCFFHVLVLVGILSPGHIIYLFSVQLWIRNYIHPHTNSCLTSSERSTYSMKHFWPHHSAEYSALGLVLLSPTFE